VVEQIQKRGHKQSQYDLQISEWRCDGARLGAPCDKGPLKNGNCPHAKKGTRHPCKPSQANGKNQCTRSEQQGGVCEKGPDEFGNCGITYPACRPRVSNTRKRRQITRVMIVLAVSFLAIVLGSDHMKTWMQTDNISLQHRFSNNCEACHSNSGNSFSDWWIIGNKNLWSQEPANEYPCTQCHQFTGPEMTAHNLEKAQITVIQKHINPTLPHQDNDKIACHQCHQEHQGPNGITAKLNNKQCQSCHQKKYSGIDESHPEFTQFPVVKKSRPLFDHDKHFKRFQKNKYKTTRPEECSSCHMQDAIGNIQMPIFEEACADCHLQKDILDIGGKQASAVSWLSVPRMDAEKLSIGLWPNCRSSGLKTIDTLSPITLSLLNTNPLAKIAIQLLKDNNTRFDKIEQAAPDEILAMTTLAWAFKKLLWDLNNGEKIKWQSEPTKLSKLEKTFYTQAISINSDMLKSFTQQFFPDLANTVGETNTNVDGVCMDKKQISQLKKQWGKRKLNGIQGWYIQFNLKTMELGYRTQQHKDLIQKSLMDQYWNDSETFKWLVEKKKSINCQKCHRQNNEANAWQWKQSDSKFSTQFRHKPHVVLGVDCSNCHQLSHVAKDSKIMKKTPDWQLTNHSDFLKIKKDNCQSCHKQNGRTQQCSSCHKYHGKSKMLHRNFESWQQSSVLTKSKVKP